MIKIIVALLILFSTSSTLAAGANYGNFCGPGNHQWGKDPIDDLDEACMNHDDCLRNNGAADGHPVCHCEQNFLQDLEDISGNISWLNLVKKSYASGAKVFARNRISKACGE